MLKKVEILAQVSRIIWYVCDLILVHLLPDITYLIFLCLDKVSEVRIGQWAVVSFRMYEKNTQTRRYIGQITDVRNGKFIGEFLRSTITKDHNGRVFKYPVKKDESTFKFSQIVKVLDDPEPYGRYGLLLFNIQPKDL